MIDDRCSALDAQRSACSTPSPAGYSKVGRRVRSRRKVDRAYGAKNAGGGKVPRERALVPTGSALRPWRRDVPDSA